MQQRAGHPVQRARFLIVVRTGDVDDVALDLDADQRVNVLGQGALRPLDGDGVAVDLEFHTGGQLDGLATDSRHSVLPPYHTNASTSPPTFSLRAALSVITPLEVETIAVPMPFMTFGISSLLE